MFVHRNSCTFLCTFILGLLFFQRAAICQELFHPFSAPVADSLNVSSLSFDRILNTYLWTGDFIKKFSGQFWNLDFHQQIRSRIIETDQTAIQDEYDGLIALRARLLDDWNFQFKNSSTVLADNRAIDLSRMADHQFLTGFEYVPTGNIAGEAMGGYELNTQEEENDHGFAYELGFNARQITLEEFNASLQSSWNQSFLGRRSPNTGDIKLTLLRNFGAGIDDSIAINYSTQRRQFYTSIDSSSQQALGVPYNILQRDASVLEISNQTKYNIGRNFFTVVSIGISNQLIDRGYRYKDYLHPASLILDSHIQEMQFFGNISMQWHPIYWL